MGRPCYNVSCTKSKNDQCIKDGDNLFYTCKDRISSENIMSGLVDTGVREELETGAVREMNCGKGRCDLLPYEAVMKLHRIAFELNKPEGDPLIHTLDRLLFYTTGLSTKQERVLEQAFLSISEYLVVSDNGVYAGNNQQLLSQGLLEVSHQFEEGALKYAERNWEKGLPLRSYLDSAIRHLLKEIAGLSDEPHARACAWNILCAIQTNLMFPKEKDNYRFRSTVLAEK